MMRTFSSLWLFVGFLLVGGITGCGAKTGVSDDPRDGGSDGVIECEDPCPESTFCEPICMIDEECQPLRGPTCDDDDPCTIDRCDAVLDGCVNEVELEDLDGDGALAPIDCGGTDCDDDAPDINPDAPERCNGIDDDCDDLIDEGAELLPWGTELPVAASGQTDDASGIAWIGNEYIYGYWDYRDGDADVFLQRLTPEGEYVDEAVQVTTSAGDGYGPNILWTGSELGVVWSDRREGNFEIFFARFTGELERLTGDIRVTNNDEWSLYPKLTWSGREYLVVWQDERSMAFEAYAQRIGPTGLNGDALRLSSSGAMGQTAESPSVAFDGEMYHAVWLEGGLTRYDLRYSLLDQLLNLRDTYLVTDGTMGSASSPTVAAGPNTAAIAWEQADGTGFDTMVVVVSGEGVQQGVPTMINAAGVTAREPSLLWDNNGFVVISSVFSATFDLSFAVIDPNGIETQPLTTFVESRADAVSAIVALGAGEIGVGWSDSRNGTYDAYFTRLLCAGL